MRDRKYSSVEVAKLSGASFRQLQWWDERRVVQPVHMGHKRIYSQEDAVVVAVLVELRNKGFSLQRIRKMLQAVRRELSQVTSELSDPAVQLYLLVDGKRGVFERSESRVVDILKRARCGIYAVSIGDQVRKVLGIKPGS